MDSLPHLSGLQERRASEYRPQVPHVLDEAAVGLVTVSSEPLLTREERETSAGSTGEEMGPLKRLFPRLCGGTRTAIAIRPAVGQQERLHGKPLKIAVVLSGGPAAGGHNVISGLHEYLTARCEESTLIGFVGGPKGVMTGDHIVITASLLRRYQNLGGFDIITTGRDKIESPEQFSAALATVTKLGLDGLVVIGGDDSNTNAAMLAEYFAQNGSECSVIGVPKTIDGDLKNEHVEVSFGFDTATKTYAELIGNIMTDAKSSKKYYHFVRLMGRSASHIALECALVTHPNAALIGEEVAYKRKTLSQITNLLADIVEERAAKGIRFGVFLVPEGLIEFIPEVGSLIQELNDLLARNTPIERIREKLSPSSRDLLDFLPRRIREQLMLERDPHGNVQVSKIETEKLLMDLVATELKARSGFKGPFNSIGHFFGYEGRCAMPSNFDCNYCSALGKTAGVLLEHKATGMMAIVRNLSGPVQMWQPGGYPLTAMMHLEKRKGKLKPVIRKALVDVTAKPFLTFKKNRQRWTTSNDFVNPGPIQFYGPFCNTVCTTLSLEHGKDYDAGSPPPAGQVKLQAKL